MKHFYTELDGWFTFPALYDLAVNEAPQNAHFVEVGVWKGCSAAFMAVQIINSGKNIKFDCVDTWEGSAEHQTDPDVISGKLYECFIENMKPVEGHYTPVRMESTEAAKLYEDCSLDFVFIDASHDYQNVKNDIIAWYPKIKVGGKLAGHDYNWGTVRGAVHDLLHYRGIMTDHVSWFTVKQNTDPLIYQINPYVK